MGLSGAQPLDEARALSLVRGVGLLDALGVRVRYLGEDRGYAGVASRAIAAGDVLVRVPRSKMLTAADARACPAIGAAARALSDHRALVLKLLHEKAAFEATAANTDSDLYSDDEPWRITRNTKPPFVRPVTLSARKRWGY